MAPRICGSGRRRCRAAGPVGHNRAIEIALDQRVISPYFARSKCWNRLMRIDICKGLQDDTLTITRANGSRALTRFPKKGPIPHDGVHLIVERALSMRRAFWGYIAQGRHPEDIAKLAADAGHPSAKRASAPDVAIIELVQAERLVECFEAEVWGGAGDIAVLQSVADAAMFQSMVSPVPLPLDAVARIRTELAAFSADWRALAVGETISLDWPE